MNPGSNRGRIAAFAGAGLALAGLAYYAYRRWNRPPPIPRGPRNMITPAMLRNQRANLRSADYGVASSSHERIHVRRNPGQTSTQFVDFMRHTRQAIARLDSRPVGRQMLQDLNQSYQLGHHQRLPDLDLTSGNQIVETNVHIRQSPTNRTVYHHDPVGLHHDRDQHVINSPAFRRNGAAGAGQIVSTIEYNPHNNRSDGQRRPAFIALGHEMVHAWRARQGVAVHRYRHPATGAPALNPRARVFLKAMTTTRDELETVGIAGTPRMPNAPTENRLRAEHHIGLRPSYSGLGMHTLQTGLQTLRTTPPGITRTYMVRTLRSLVG